MEERDEKGDRPMVNPGSGPALFCSLGKWPSLRVDGCLVCVEGRTLNTVVAESHREGMEAAGLEGAASGLVKRFIVTMMDWGFESTLSFGITKEGFQILMWPYRNQGSTPHNWHWPRRMTTQSHFDLKKRQECAVSCASGDANWDSYFYI